MTTADMTAPTQFVTLYLEWIEKTTMRVRTFLMTQLSARTTGNTATLTNPILTEPGTAILISSDFNLSAGRIPTYELAVSLEQQR